MANGPRRGTTGRCQCRVVSSHVKTRYTPQRWGDTLVCDNEAKVIPQPPQKRGSLGKTRRWGVLSKVYVHLHRLSEWGKSEFHTHGYWILDQVVMITERVISTSSLQSHKWEYCMAWWANQTSWLGWYAGLKSVEKTIQSSLRRMETSCHHMVRMNDNYQGRVITVLFFNHSSNIISQTDTNLSNGMENKALMRSLGGLVDPRFHLVLVGYSVEYEMKLMINKYLVNCNIASVR